MDIFAYFIETIKDSKEGNIIKQALKLSDFIVDYHYVSSKDEILKLLSTDSIIDSITKNLIKQDVIKNMEIHKVKEVVTQLHKNLEHFNKLHNIETKTIRTFTQIGGFSPLLTGFG